MGPGPPSGPHAVQHPPERVGARAAATAPRRRRGGAVVLLPRLLLWTRGQRGQARKAGVKPPRRRHLLLRGEAGDSGNASCWARCCGMSGQRRCRQVRARRGERCGCCKGPGGLRKGRHGHGRLPSQGAVGDACRRAGHAALGQDRSGGKRYVQAGAAAGRDRRPAGRESAAAAGRAG